MGTVDKKEMPTVMSPMDKRAYDQHMAMLMYQTMYEIRIAHKLETKPWTRINKVSKGIWLEFASKLMGAAAIGEEDEAKGTSKLKGKNIL